MNGKIIVVTHKDYEMPADEIYFPICVGNSIPQLQKKFQPDNIGENISEKNITYCELTAIYWAWKNLDLEKLDYIGVAHYRRHFSLKKGSKTLSDAIGRESVESLMKMAGDTQIITPPERFYFSSVQDHYIRAIKSYKKIHTKDIRRLKRSIHELSPSYDKYALKILTGHKVHMLNMYIMSAKNFDNYCTWLFPVIDRVVELSSDRADRKRFAGGLAELCLDIWASRNNIEIREIPLLETEKPPFATKVFQTIKRKLQ